MRRSTRKQKVRKVVAAIDLVDVAVKQLEKDEPSVDAALDWELRSQSRWRKEGHIDRLSGDARRAYDDKLAEYNRLFPHPSTWHAVDPAQVPAIRALGAELRAMAPPAPNPVPGAEAYITELRKGVDLFDWTIRHHGGKPWTAAAKMQWRTIEAMTVARYRQGKQYDFDAAQVDEIHQLFMRLRAIHDECGLHISNAEVEQTVVSLAEVGRRGVKEPRN